MKMKWSKITKIQAREYLLFMNSQIFFVKLKWLKIATVVSNFTQYACKNRKQRISNHFS